MWGNVSGGRHFVQMKFSLLALTYCPRCNNKGSLRKILWGLPDEEPDETKHVVGGCCISDNDPEHACTNCD